jgi:hypothetical protein
LSLLEEPLCGPSIMSLVVCQQVGASVEGAIRRLDAMLPDEHVPERELHQAVDGDVRRETQVGSPGVDPPEHGPFKDWFVSLFFKQSQLLLLNDFLAEVSHLPRRDRDDRSALSGFRIGEGKDEHHEREE